MSINEIRGLFPIKAEITQEIIDAADILDIAQCIGAKTLKSVVSENLRCTWGVYMGYISYGYNRELTLTTAEDVNMMYVTKPTKVTFILKEY